MRWLCLLAILGGCACSSPAARQNAGLAAEAGATREELVGKGYRHTVYARERSSSASETALHIYVGGDGRAFVNRRSVALDPTSYPDQALQLMLEDSATTYYIGRPCYHGAAVDEGCEARLWTTKRYSMEVVDSVASVIDTLHRRHPNKDIRLIGYSGGGVIALLAAIQLSYVRSVVTVASPLDTEAWIKLHGYSPLIDSINPVEIEQWPVELRQWHFLGGEDVNVTYETQSRFRQKMQTLSQPAKFLMIPGQHHCCWSESWRQILLEKLWVDEEY